jgi:hypothetical protein
MYTQEFEEENYMGYLSQTENWVKRESRKQESRRQAKIHQAHTEWYLYCWGKQEKRGLFKRYIPFPNNRILP